MLICLYAGLRPSRLCHNPKSCNWHCFIIRGLTLNPRYFNRLFRWIPDQVRHDAKNNGFFSDYDHNLELDDYKEMAAILGKIKAQFILNINFDHPTMRKTFKGFNIEPVTLKYSVAEKKATTGMELLISNF